MQAGSGITLTDNGSNTFTIDADGGGGGGSVTSVAATHAGDAFAVTIGNDPTINPSIDIDVIGSVDQYINGEGNLINFPDVNNGNGAFVPIGTIANSDIYNANWNSQFPTARSVVIGINQMSSDDTAALEIHGRVSQITGNLSTFFGYEAGYDNPFSQSNTAFGHQAMKSTTDGHSNIAVGYQALNGNEVGYSNVAVGYLSLLSNNSNLNTAVGSLSLKENTTGTQNTAIGHGAMLSSLVGSDNIAIGYSALSNNNGNESCVIGNHGYGNTLSKEVVGIGHDVGRWCEGFHTVMIGTKAGVKIGTDDNNFAGVAEDSIFIGYDSRPANSDSINEVVIGASAVGKGDNTVVLGNASIEETHLKGVVVLEGYTFANLPASPVVGMRTYLTDSVAPSYYQPASGGGFLNVPVFYNGIEWMWA